MRIDKIELRRLGIFDDCTLDLSQGDQGVHIVHGPNEAGKSTMLSALEWMLFGFPHNKHDFLYSNDTRAGAVLRKGKETLAFLRKKGRNKTLETPGRDALDDDALSPFLGKVTEDLFKNFYGLDHRQLTGGGREIVAAKGEAGQALFAAAGGLQAVQQLATALQNECEGIFKARASTPLLNFALKAYSEANKRVQEAELRTDDYRKLERAAQEADDRTVALTRSLEELTQKREWLERCRKVYGVLTQLNAVRIEIEEFGGHPPLRDDFRHDLHQAQRDHAHAIKEAEEADKKRAALRERFEALTVETRFLEHAQAIETLAAEATTVRAAINDREALASDIRSRREQAARILADLGHEAAKDNPRAILPNATVRGAVAELAEECSGLAAHLDSAKRSERQAAEALEQAGQALAAAPEAVDTAAVEAALAKAQRVIGDEDRMEALEQGIADQHAHLEARLQRMGRWRGALEQARALAVPDEATIARFKEDFAESERTRQQLDTKREELDAEHGRTAQELAKLARGESIPTEAELARLRERRDAAWSALRDAWLAGADPKALPEDVRARVLEEAAAEGFSGAEAIEGFAWRIQRADEVADRLRREAERVADHATATARLEQLEQLRQTAAQALEEHAAGHAALEAKWGECWKSPVIDHGTPAEMLAWRKEWAELVRGIEQLAADAAEESRVRQRVNAARADILEAWRAIHPLASDFDTANLAALTYAAAKWTKEAQQSRLESDQLNETCSRLRNTDLPAAQTAVRDAAKAMKAWEAQWTKHMKAIGLPGDAKPRQANAMLEGLDALKEVLDALEGLERRVQDIDGRQTRFQADAVKVFKAVGFDAGAEPPEEAARTLNALRERHARDDAARAGFAKQIEDEDARYRDAQRRVEEASEALRKLCEEARVDSFDDLPEAEEHAAKLRDRLAKRARLEEDIAREAMGETLEDFEARVCEEDAETLEPRLETLADEIQRMKSECDAAQQELGAARSKLLAVDGANTAAEAAQDAADHQARVLTLAEEFSRLALAHTMLRDAIQRYREKNQGPMLARASAYFQELTLGSFRELRAGYDEKGAAVLLGVRPDDRETLVEGMSDGAADQLYLALRLAAIELRAEREDPMPLILDDVLINFDDARARAALSALASLSKHTQVILFTHHAHLIDLAQEALPRDVIQIHELRPATAAAD